MTFSVIIPTYNRALMLKSTLESVLDQEYDDYEIIVVDDGSTDQTREVTERFGNSRIRYFHKTNEERSIARNYGAAKAIGRYLIFLDSDDRMQSDHLRGVEKFLRLKDFKPRFVFSGYKVLNAQEKIVYSYHPAGSFAPRKLLYGNYLGCSAVVIERELFLRNHFNTAPLLIIFEDWELWLRIIAKEPLYCTGAGSIIMSNHEGRSVLNTDAVSLQNKINCFLQLAGHSPFVQRSRAGKKKLAMGLYSYAALHTALTPNNRAAALRFLAKALFSHPALILKKRFYAIIKHLF